MFLEVEKYFYTLAQNSWTDERHCNISRMCWNNLSSKRTKELLCLSREDMYKTISVLSCQCLIGRHAYRLGVPFHDFCRSCGSEEEEETVLHLLCHCPALSRARMKFLGNPFLNSLAEINLTKITSISRFINASKWLEKDESQ